MKSHEWRSQFSLLFHKNLEVPIFYCPKRSLELYLTLNGKLGVKSRFWFLPTNVQKYIVYESLKASHYPIMHGIPAWDPGQACRDHTISDVVMWWSGIVHHDDSIFMVLILYKIDTLHTRNIIDNVQSNWVHHDQLLMKYCRIAVTCRYAEHTGMAVCRKQLIHPSYMSYDIMLLNNNEI